MAAAHHLELTLQPASCAIPAYRTDFLLVAEHDLQRAIESLERAGHNIYRSENE